MSQVQSRARLTLRRQAERDVRSPDFFQAGGHDAMGDFGLIALPA